MMPVGSHGDVHPFVGIGLELARRGHRVVTYTSGYFAALFEALGLELIDAFPADEFRELLDDPRLWVPGPRSVRLVFEMAARHAGAQLSLLASRRDERDLLVVASPLAFGARIAQELHGIRLATVQLAPSPIPSLERPPDLPGVWMPSWMPMWLRRAQRALLGIAFDRMFTSHHILTTSGIRGRDQLSDASLSTAR